MNDEKPIDATPELQEPDTDQPGGERQESPLMRLPGLAAISLYMLLLAGTVILGVIGKHFPPLYLFFPTLFLAAGMGLLMMLRWAWALSLGAVAMLVAMFLYLFTRQHALPWLVQGLLNMVFFLYLVRSEVRSSLR